MPVLDSTRVVYRATANRIQRAFQRVQKYVPAVKSPLYVKSERDQPRQVVKAYPSSSSKGVEKTQRALAAVPLPVVHTVLRALLPRADTIGLAMFDANRYWDKYNELYELDANTRKRVPPRALLAQVLCGGGPDYDAFLQRVADIVAEPLRKEQEEREVRLGDTLVVQNALTPLWTPRGHSLRWLQRGGGTNTRKATMLEMVHAAIGALRQRVDTGKTYEGHTALELDGDYVEVKTLKHKRVTIQALLAELCDHEDAALAVARELDATARILPHSGYMVYDANASGEVESHGSPGGHGNPGNPESPGRPQYAGSYHFWFTLPHTPATARTPHAQAEFVRLHAAFGHALQWLEPLLLTCMAGDPRAIGAGSSYPRASMRGTLNSLAGMGTTDACGMAQDVEVGFPAGRSFMYYADEKSLAASSVRGNDKPTGLKLHNSGRHGTRVAVTLPGGKRELMLSCLSVDRSNAWMRDADMYRTPAPAVTPTSDHFNPSQELLHNVILRTRYAAGFKTHEGNDLRFAWCDKLGLKLLPGWKPAIVRSPRGGGIEFQMRFVHAKTGVVEKVAPLKKTDGDLVGFEFRLMDNMPREALLPLMRLYVLTMAAADTRRGTMCSRTHRAKDDPHWAALTAAVLAEGRFARVPTAYVRKLWATLGLSIEKLDKINNKIKDARDALLCVSRSLHDKHGKHPWVALLSSSRADEGPPVHPDTNMQAWSDAFEAKCRASPELRDIVADISKQKTWDAKAVLQRMGASADSWRYDLPYLREHLSARRQSS